MTKFPGAVTCEKLDLTISPEFTVSIYLKVKPPLHQQAKLHVFQHLRERQGETENRIRCITSQEASVVQQKKTSKCGQKSYFLWKLHYNFPVYIYVVLDLVAARRNLKKQLSQNPASKFLFALQPTWIDVLAGCLFSLPEDNTTAFQEMVLDFFVCLASIF